MNDVWFCATRGRLADVRSLLQQFSSADRLKVPAALALRGIENVLDGDVRGGVSVLRRAADRAIGAEKQYITELAVPYAFSIDELALGKGMIDEAGDVVSPLRPAFLALQSIFATRTGFEAESRNFARLAETALEETEDPMIACRTLHRLGLAAYYRQDYEEAQERSLEAARAYERLNALRGATTSYSVLYAIASSQLANPIIARNYAIRITDLATRDGDYTMQNYGLMAQFELAADAGDMRRLGSIRARILANPLHEQYHERFAYVYADSLSQGWNKNFELVRAAISGLQRRGAISAPENMMCDAMLALCDVARWDIEDARGRALSVVQRTAARSGVEALYDVQHKRIARVLASCALILIGDITRGRRALGRGVDPDGFFGRLDPTTNFDVERATPMMKGYALFINAVHDAAKAARPSHGLTRAEFEVLEALATGLSRKELAAELGKTENTVMKQIGAIYAKLDVSSRAQAVRKARSLGILT